VRGVKEGAFWDYQGQIKGGKGDSIGEAARRGDREWSHMRGGREDSGTRWALGGGEGPMIIPLTTQEKKTVGNGSCVNSSAQMATRGKDDFKAISGN